MDGFGTFYDPYLAADELRVPVEKVFLLRRLLDPNLTKAEHDEIVPLDFGKIRDLPSFSAMKRHIDSKYILDKESPHEKAVAIKEATEEWRSIHEQIGAIFKYGLMGQCLTPTINNGQLLLMQHFVEAGFSHRFLYVHADSPKTMPLFEKTWQPPTLITISARDNEPNTVYFPGVQTLPEHLVARQHSILHSMEHAVRNERLAAAIRETVKREGPNEELEILLRKAEIVPDKIYFFHKEFMAWAEKEKKTAKVPAGHLGIGTDRLLHTAMPNIIDERRTFARAYGLIKNLHL